MKFRINYRLFYVFFMAVTLALVVIIANAQETDPSINLTTTVQSNTQVSLSWQQLATGSFESPVNLTWFYIPPEDESKLPTISDNFDHFVLTKNFEDDRDYLQNEGYTVLQYTKFDAIDDPCFQALKPTGTTCNCGSNPLNNQVAWEPNDVCYIRDNHPDWFLRDALGNIMYASQGNKDEVIMDPGNQGWRDFWLNRLIPEQEAGWDGIFIDNMATTFTRHGAAPTDLQKYTTQQWREAVTGFLKYAHDNYFAAANKDMFANLSVYWKEDDTYYQFLQYLDGTMDEHWAVPGNDTSTYSELSWEDRLLRVQQTLSLGKQMMLVSRGERWNGARQRFALASYLLIAEDDAYFRYSRQSDYRSIWLYDNYDVALGNPLGSYYQDGNTWRRDFDNGQVSVTPSTNNASITVTGLTVQVQRAFGANGAYTTIHNAPPNSASYTDSNIQGGGEYCYRLKVTEGDGSFRYSNVSCKTVDGNGSSAANSPVGTLSMGTGNPTYSWHPASGATSYYLYIGTDSGQEMVYIEVKASDYCNSTECAIDPTELNSAFYLPNGDYIIYINPVTNGHMGDWDGPVSFTLNADQPSRPKGLTVSVNQGRPSVEWPDDSDSSWYQIWVGSPNYKVTQHYDWYEKDSSICNNGDCRLVLNTHPTNGNYVLFMRSWGSGGFSDWSDPYSLNINFDAPSGIETLTATNISSDSPKFRWRGESGATWYQLWVGTLTPNVTTAYMGWHSALDATCEQGGGTCLVQPENINLQTNKTYVWYVRAWGPGGYSTGSEGGWYRGPDLNR